MKPLGAAFITFVRFRDPRRPQREPSERGFAAERESGVSSLRQGYRLSLGAGPSDSAVSSDRSRRPVPAD
jgi:hypothetical protein